MVQHARKVLVGGLGLDKAHELFAEKDSIVGIAAALGLRARGPFGDDPVMARLGARTQRIAQGGRIDLPADFSQLPVDQAAHFRFGYGFFHGACLGHLFLPHAVFQKYPQK